MDFQFIGLPAACLSEQKTAPKSDFSYQKEDNAQYRISLKMTEKEHWGCQKKHLKNNK